MNARPAWMKVNPEAMKGMMEVTQSTTLDKRLAHLIEVRVSQINGCAFCLDMHAQEARRWGETQQRLDCLAGWRDYPGFTPGEKAALAWAEALTLVAQNHAPEVLYQALTAHFDERQIVDLTVVITVINAWNRLQIGMAATPVVR